MSQQSDRGKRYHDFGSYEASAKKRFMIAAKDVRSGTLCGIKMLAVCRELVAGLKRLSQVHNLRGACSEEFP